MENTKASKRYASVLLDREVKSEVEHICVDNKARGAGETNVSDWIAQAVKERLERDRGSGN